MRRRGAEQRYTGHARTKYDDLDRGATRFADRLAQPLEHEWAPVALDDGETARLIP